MKTMLVLSILCIFAAGGSGQTTWYVPDDFPAGIQAALSSPSVAAGDTVVVRPGVYVENINFLGKDIALVSELGPGATIIDGGQAGSVVVFAGGEGQDAVLSGFTLTNGTGTLDPNGTLSGGGIYVNTGAHPTIRGNVIAGNDSTYQGGGISCQPDASPKIVENRIAENTAGDSGGGIACGTDTEVAFNVITGNHCSYGGGGIACGGAASISFNTITKNSADFAGGGVAVNDSSAVRVVANIIRTNATGFAGGGIACGSNTNVAGNIIAGNLAALAGGGIACQIAQGTEFNANTITGNQAQQFGGGVCLQALATASMVNSIVWGNAAPAGPQICLETLCALTVSYCDVQGGEADAYVGSTSVLNWGAGMIDSDPLFAGAAAGDYHLTYTSPCRNAGDNPSVPVFLTWDMEHDPRIHDSVTDIGADEFHTHLYSVGAVIPGSVIAIRTVGEPGNPAIVALGSGVLDPPKLTAYGLLYLQLPPVLTRNLGAIPADGIRDLLAVVPASWSPGGEHPLQALVGPFGGVDTQLTNLLTLTVE